MPEPKKLHIPDDIAAKCSEPGQFEKFDTEFSKMARNTGSKEPKAKRGRGRPKKSKA
jgi:hypothetical protein